MVDAADQCRSCRHDVGPTEKFCSACGVSTDPAVDVIDVNVLATSETSATSASMPRWQSVATGVAIVAAVALALVAVTAGSDSPAEEASAEPTAQPTVELVPGPTVSPAPESSTEVAGVEEEDGPPPNIDRSVDRPDLAAAINDRVGPIAVRTGGEVEVFSTVTGTSLGVTELAGYAGGDVWFGDGIVTLRRAGSAEGPAFTVVELATGFRRDYTALDFSLFSATSTRAIGLETGRLFGGGRWTTIDFDGFGRVPLGFEPSAAFPVPIALDAGVLVQQGSQVVLESGGRPTVLGTGEVVAWSMTSVLLRDCDALLDCSWTSVDLDGSVLAMGPAIAIPQRSLAGQTRWLSPDGQTLALIDPSTRTLELSDVATGDHIAHDLGRTSSHSLVWSPDSSEVIVADQSQLAVIGLDGTTALVAFDRTIDQVGLVGASGNEATPNPGQQPVARLAAGDGVRANWSGTIGADRAFTMWVAQTDTMLRGELTFDDGPSSLLLGTVSENSEFYALRAFTPDGVVTDTFVFTTSSNPLTIRGTWRGDGDRRSTELPIAASFDDNDELPYFFDPLVRAGTYQYTFPTRDTDVGESDCCGWTGELTISAVDETSMTIEILTQRQGGEPQRAVVAETNVALDGNRAVVELSPTCVVDITVFDGFVFVAVTPSVAVCPFDVGTTVAGIYVLPERWSE